ncbi:MAG: aspartate kinase [Cyclobacteriaceae bacterium]
MLRVYKFGGASVKDAKGVQNLAEIVKNDSSEQLIIVISAMGKTTNDLTSIVKQKLGGQNFEILTKSVIDHHRKISDQLLGYVPGEQTVLEDELVTALGEEATDELAFQDRIIAFGELLSTTIIAKYLNTNWVDARDYIRTDACFTEAEVDWGKTEKLIARDFPDLLKHGAIVTQGFIAGNDHGQTTTLGREGSDFSGAIFASILKAASLTVWKDVPGLLNADPKIFPEAEKFDHVSYQEVIEMTYYGAKVIHPKTIHPLAKGGIPLFVKSFLQPDYSGTEISEDKKTSTKTCFIFKENQLLVSARVKDNSFMDERKMSAILNALNGTNVKANLIHNSALTFTFCMDDNEKKRERIIDQLNEDFQVLYNTGLSLATIKNYQEGSFEMLPKGIEIIIEEKSRSNYQVVYRVK